MIPQARDLFGEPVRRLKGNGYAGSPGAGPAGETCGSCRYLRRCSTGNKRFCKCYHQLGRRSNCEATDILVSAPACEFWTVASECV